MASDTSAHASPRALLGSHWQSGGVGTTVHLGFEGGSRGSLPAALLARYPDCLLAAMLRDPALAPGVTDPANPLHTGRSAALWPFVEELFRWGASWHPEAPGLLPCPRASGLDQAWPQRSGHRPDSGCSDKSPAAQLAHAQLAHLDSTRRETPTALSSVWAPTRLACLTRGGS
jgi:hypothetical protein